MSAINRLPVVYTSPDPVSPETKWCPGCKSDHPQSEFGPNPSEPTGLAVYCRAFMRARYQETKQDRPWHTRHIERTYGISIDEYNRILMEQHGTCAICCGVPKGRKSLAVDHDHTTGQVRGLLCEKCNIGIGSFKDDPMLMQTAIAYLKLHGK